MDAQRASGAPISVELGDTRRTFDRLSRRAICEIISQMPAGSEEERRWYGVFELNRWSSTPEGSVAILAKASGEDPSTVETWGSEVSRATAAGLVVVESVLSGEEPEPSHDKKPEGEHRPDFPETSSKRPGSSRNTRRGLAILGRLRRRLGMRR